MLNWKKWLLPIVIGLSVVLIAGVFTAFAVIKDDEKDNGMEGAQYHHEMYGDERHNGHDGKDGQRGRGGHDGHGGHGMHGVFHKGPGHEASIEHQTLMALLVEKYSIDTKAAWDSALAEQIKVHDEVNALVEAGDWQKPNPTAEQRDAHEALRDASKQAEDDLHAALKAKDTAKIKTALAAVLKSIEAHNEQIRQEIADAKVTEN
jgi:hypothetical protein